MQIVREHLVERCHPPRLDAVNYKLPSKGPGIARVFHFCAALLLCLGTVWCVLAKLCADALYRAQKRLLGNRTVAREGLDIGPLRLQDV